ncbi:MAG TPA: S-layer homology domain-containing protein [Candidatus Scatomorpha merdavium]|nr:S-layer homology domain-containing protein [Candidatus Scatomorpha merdavium]
MKKLFVLALTAALILCALCFGASATSGQPAGSGTAADPYQIRTADELYWFAQYGGSSAHAKLMNDITINENVLDVDGDLNGTGLREWTPINNYTGTFDGGGHGISGLYINIENGISDTYVYVGLFGYIGRGGKVQDLNIKDSDITGSATVNDAGVSVGSVCGENHGTIENCSNSGTVTGSGNVGGFCGYNNAGTIENCYNTGPVSGSVTGKDAIANVGGVCGRNNGGTITNCYWLNTSCDSGIGGGNGTSEKVESKSADQFTSGEVTWLLNAPQTAGPWRQTLVENGDKFPNLDSTHREVVRVTVDEDYVSYLNSGDDFNGEPNKVYFDTKGKRVDVPYPVTADTTLTTKSLVTPSITGSVTKTYDGDTSVPEGHGLSITLGDIATGADVTATASSYTYEDKNAGEVKTIKASGITLAGDDADNYVLSTDTVTADVGEITPRTLTITAEDKNANMGDAIPELTYKVDGLVGSDKLLEAPELTGVPDMTKAGEYPITVIGGLASENYTISYVNGKLVVGVSYVVTADGAVYYVLPKVGSFILPAAPSKPGYIFMGWSDGNNTFQPGDEVGLFGDTDFTSVWANMPDITSPEPDKPDELPFTDVPKTAWYYDAVKTAYEAGIVNGVTDTLFEPDGTLTRAMFWTILARVDGVDTAGGATWYSRAQQWAIENGVSDGSDPMGALTREQLVTMLWRLNGEPVVDYLITAPDASQISSWALEAMRWAASIGLIEGDETGALNPTATTTRAQAATFMVRYLAAE